jgi:hypothetical protein
LLTCVNALGEPGRLSPPIWPCTTRGFPCLRCCHRSGGLLPHLFTLAKLSERFEDVPQVFLRDATVLLSAGGIFSVALSVNSSTGFSLCSFSSRTMHHSHRGEKATQTEGCATAPLALPGALPFTPSLQSRRRVYPEARRPRIYSSPALASLRRRCPDFPPAQPSCDDQASDHPAHPPFILYRETVWICVPAAEITTSALAIFHIRSR